MPGINVYEFFILIILALVLLGPERLPQYAQTLAVWAKKARGMAEDAKHRFREETGTDFDDVDWQRYDPRQYDPRRIIREALAEDDGAGASASRRSTDPRDLFPSSGASTQGSALAAGVAGAAAAGGSNAGATDHQDSSVAAAAPFDSDAT